jgi:hypothetical protein
MNRAFRLAVWRCANSWTSPQAALEGRAFGAEQIPSYRGAATAPGSQIALGKVRQEFLKVEGINSLWFPSYFIINQEGLGEMNPKIANLIAIELGILIGLVSWLTYSRFPSAEPRTSAEMRESSVAPVTAAAPGFQPRSQRPYAVDYSADRERAQPADEQPAQWEQSYYQSIAPQRYARSAVATDSIAVDSPSYAETYQEPAAVSSDDLATPQTVVYSQPIQTIVYQPIQVVGFSNPRRFVNRCRSTPPLNGVPATITHPCPDRGNSHLSDTRVVSGPNVSTPPCPPTQGPRPRGAVSQAVVTGGEQKRVAFPASSGTARRLTP